MSTRQKSIPVIMILLLFSSLTCSLKDLRNIEKPKATIEKFDIESISLRDITFLFHIGITNPYPISLKLDDIGLKFYIEKKQLFKTNTSGGFKIGARKKKVSIFRVNLKYTDIIKIVRYYTKKDYLNCVVDIDIVIPLPRVPGLPKNVKFNYKLKKKIPAIKPSIKITNFRVQKPSMADIRKEMAKMRRSITDSRKIYGMFGDIISGRKPKNVIDPSRLDLKLKVNFDIELKNNTRAKLLFQDLNYDFYINSSKLVSGKTSNIKSYGNKSILRVANEFSSKALGKSILNAFKNSVGNFSLKGHSFIKLPDSIKKEPLKLEFNENGRFKLK